MLLFVQMLVQQVFSAPIVKSARMKLIWNAVAIILAILNLTVLFFALTVMRVGKVDAALFMILFATAASASVWLAIRSSKHNPRFRQQLEELVERL